MYTFLKKPTWPKMDCTKHLMPKVSLKVDKEALKTVPVEDDFVDLDELILSYKDSCGMAAIQKLLAKGLASPGDFADDGLHGVDLTGVADNLNDAYQKQQLLGEKLAEIEAQLGLDSGTLTADNYSDQIKAAIQAKLDAAAASVTKEGE